MAIGFLSVSGICAGTDSVDAAPWFVSLGLLGSLGWMLLYPIWLFWFGHLLLSQTETTYVPSHV
jgi:hypothetical protein